jgi:hypothetical protein
MFHILLSCDSQGSMECMYVCREIRLEVNADKTKYMVMFRDQNAGPSHNMKIRNRSFEMVKEFKYSYLGTT